MHARQILAGGLLILCAGCHDGGDSKPTPTAPPAFLVLHLATGEVKGYQQVNDLSTNPAYGVTHMVFRRVEGGVATFGTPAASPFFEPDEPQTTLKLSPYYIGVFEVTQGQWAEIAKLSTLDGIPEGSTDHPWPWQEVLPNAAFGQSALRKPAFGISLALARTLVGAANSVWVKKVGTSIALPSGIQWEFACRQNTGAAYSWGSSTDPATVAQHAQVLSTNNGQAGPALVGSRQGNILGLFDLHGNVREWTSDGFLRGGGWSDNLATCQAANRIHQDEDLPHGLGGMRLVLVQ